MSNNNKHLKIKRRSDVTYKVISLNEVTETEALMAVIQQRFETTSTFKLLLESKPEIELKSIEQIKDAIYQNEGAIILVDEDEFEVIGNQPQKIEKQQENTQMTIGIQKLKKEEDKEEEKVDISEEKKKMQQELKQGSQEPMDFKKLTELIQNKIKDQIPQIREQILKEISNKKKEQQEEEKFEELLQLDDDKVTHNKYTCDGCGMDPIVGVRYKCSVCQNFDYCEKCESSIDHVHPFLKIKNPSQNPHLLFVILNDDSLNQNANQNNQYIQQNVFQSTGGRRCNKFRNEQKLSNQDRFVVKYNLRTKLITESQKEVVCEIEIENRSFRKIKKNTHYISFEHPEFNSELSFIPPIKKGESKKIEVKLNNYKKVGQYQEKFFITNLNEQLEKQFESEIVFESHQEHQIQQQVNNINQINNDKKIADQKLLEEFKQKNPYQVKTIEALIAKNEISVQFAIKLVEKYKNNLNFIQGKLDTSKKLKEIIGKDIETIFCEIENKYCDFQELVESFLK